MNGVCPVEPRKLFYFYTVDIVKMYGLPEAYTHILMAFTRKRNLDNQLTLNASIKKEIGNDLGYTVGSLNNVIQKLIDCNLLERTSRGVYRMNPTLFWDNKDEENIISLEIKRVYKGSTVTEYLCVQKNTHNQLGGNTHE